MARNTRFSPDREPLRQDASLQLNEDKIHGPVSFLNPTQAHFTRVTPEKAESGSSGGRVGAGDVSSDSAVRFKWTSRNNRKGRHVLVVTPEDVQNDRYDTPAASSSGREILAGIWRMCTYYPVWDVSWLVAVVFTLGSVIWVINAFFDFLPDIQGHTTFHGEILDGGGITAFIGATVFEVGSFLLMVEAVNENRAGCFGWAVENLYDEALGGNKQKGAVTRVRADHDSCSHHHKNKKNLVGNPRAMSAADGSRPRVDATPEGASSWVWWPSSRELRTHYIHDLGFLACSFQTAGATIFWISGFTALPGIYNTLSTGLLAGVYWTPQVVGGCGFVISGTLFMLETQKKWYLPALDTLGWHIGFWNLIGGLGFTLCPIFGYFPASGLQFQASCSTFWGSWAFLIGSVLQWYESLDKHAVEVDKSEPKNDEP